LSTSFVERGALPEVLAVDYTFVAVEETEVASARTSIDTKYFHNRPVRQSFNRRAVDRSSLQLQDQAERACIEKAMLYIQ
jgi:hypothetical protein